MGLTYSTSMTNTPNYIGSWKSHRYPNISGTISVHLPETIDTNFNTEALISYSKESSFRSGYSVVVMFDCNYNMVGSMTLKSFDKNITYTVTESSIKNDTTFYTGKYISNISQDYGIFRITSVL